MIVLATKPEPARTMATMCVLMRSTLGSTSCTVSDASQLRTLAYSLAH